MAQTRRGLTVGVAGLLASGTALVASSAPRGPEAHQIALCERYRKVGDDLNSTRGLTDRDPRWPAFFALSDNITDWKPATIDGLRMKALLAKEDATNPDGSEELEAMSMAWAWDVLNGLIQFGGRA